MSTIVFKPFYFLNFQKNVPNKATNINNKIYNLDF